MKSYLAHAGHVRSAASMSFVSTGGGGGRGWAELPHNRHLGVELVWAWREQRVTCPLHVAGLTHVYTWQLVT